MATRHTRTKAQRAAIAQRMRAYHAKRRAAKRAFVPPTPDGHPHQVTPPVSPLDAITPPKEPKDAKKSYATLVAENAHLTSMVEKLQQDSLDMQTAVTAAANSPLLAQVTDLIACVKLALTRKEYD